MGTMPDNPTPTRRVLELAQDRETPVTFLQHGGFSYRVGYMRSHDAQVSDQKGDDYLIVMEDGQRLVFVLCDGVGNSFYGHLGAQFLGGKIAEYLWELKGSQDPAIFNTLFCEKLNSWTYEATQLINNLDIPESISLLVRSALSQRRDAYGTQATFCAGLIDLTQQEMLLTQLGYGILGSQGDKQSRYSLTQRLSSEVWSSRTGIDGSPIIYTASSLPTAIFASTDGVLSLLNKAEHSFEIFSLPTNDLSPWFESGIGTAIDDSSFVQIWTGQPPFSEAPSAEYVLEHHEKAHEEYVLLAGHTIERESVSHYSVVSNTEMSRRKNRYTISIACATYIEKGRSSLFLVQLYLPALRAQVEEMIAQKYDKSKIEHLVSTEKLKLKQDISIELISTEIKFTLVAGKDGNVVKLSNYVDVKFLGSPVENCKIGKQQALLVVRDVKSGRILVSENFGVHVVDYAFGRVPRSWVNIATSVLLGVGSLVMFLLSIFEQIDKSFGFASGTAGLFVMGLLINHFLSAYQLPKQVKNIVP